jgi:hypothetical protein
MIRIVRIALTVLAAGAALVALVIAAIPVWLLLRVPGAIMPPEPGPDPR